MKSGHLGFLAVLCGTWIAARVATGLIPQAAIPKAVVAASLPVQPPEAVIATRSFVIEPFFTGPTPACCNPRRAGAQRQHRKDDTAILASHANLVQLLIDPADASGVSPSRSANRPAAEHAQDSRPPRRLVADVYAYSFWRFQSSGQGLTAGGQYGGSQSGAIATIGFTHDPSPPLALLLRTAVAHDNLRDREFAIGARWRPRANLPVTLSAERRLRNLGPDSFALYLAGGVGDIRLPAAFTLETYAQVGVVSGQNGGHFFDAQARADRPIWPQGPLPIHIGAGVWGGGQRGTARLDIGPSLRTEIPISDARVRISADWRFRISGNAAPDSGPALTLSTGF